MSNGDQQAEHDFRSLLKTFNRVTSFAFRVSLELKGEKTTIAGEMASVVYTKMCVTSSSIENLCRAKLFDHSAIMTLCRMVMEGMTLYFYLAETVSDDEWACRELIIRLHDTTARIKLFRAFAPKEKYRELLSGRDSLKVELGVNPFYRTLPSEARIRLLSGNEIFVRGMRIAAKRAGWEDAQFQAIYGYLSTHTHSAPMSFMRLKRHNINFSSPGEAQFSMVGLAINVAEHCLLRTSMDYLDRVPHKRSEFDPKELTEFRQEIESSTILKGQP